MRRSVGLLLTVCLMIPLIGCTARLVDFTMISTKNIELARAATFQRGKNRINGEDKASIIIVIPTGTPSIKEALDRAIESVPGAIALVDGVITAESWWIPYIFGESKYIVEGTPLIDPALASLELKSNYIISKTNKTGELAETRYVSRDEYLKIKKKYGI